ncbi:RGD1563821 (predicted) [Rattus norvegicus]|uniref:RGD1563821 (Predicted) n=1 Tax=Rattus norvegicus TaxID=10116 RepID=A6J3U5_RAT|nr:RGD1563821 (predicted) [Rattus norvegicus]
MRYCIHVAIKVELIPNALSPLPDSVQPPYQIYSLVILNKDTVLLGGKRS